jgi:hypothetical protein
MSWYVLGQLAAVAHRADERAYHTANRTTPAPAWRRNGRPLPPLLSRVVVAARHGGSTENLRQLASYRDPRAPNQQQKDNAGEKLFCELFTSAGDTDFLWAHVVLVVVADTIKL